MRCRFCGSKSVHSDKQRKNFSTGKAVAGAVVFGPVGAAAGLIGKDQAGYRCSACGAFMESLMDYGTENAVDNAIFQAKSGRSDSAYKYYKQQYCNIETVIFESSRPAQKVIEITGTVEEPIETEVEIEATVRVKHSYRYNSWNSNSPVFVVSASVNATDKNDELQINAVNTGDKVVRSAYFKADVYDDTGDLINTQECVFQGLSVAPGTSFPFEQSFDLNTKVAYRVELTCIKAAMEDDSVWRATEEDKEYIIDEQMEVGADFPRIKYVKQILNKENDIFLPSKGEEYWQCSCGIPVNLEKNCPICGKGPDEIIDAFDQKKLQEFQHNAILERAAERSQKTSALVSLTYVLVQNRKYDEAVNLYQKDDIQSLEKAIAGFEEITDWKDSEDKIKECEKKIIDIKEAKYAEAGTLLENGSEREIQDAKVIYEAIIDYKDSKQKAEECDNRLADLAEKDKEKRYSEAKSLAESGNHVAASQMFDTLAGYKDSRDLKFASEKVIADKKVKNKKLAIIAGIAAVVILVAIIAIVSIVVPNNKFKSAEECIANGQYDEALVILDELKDSGKLSGHENGDALYDALDNMVQGDKALSSHDYDEAIRYYEDAAAAIDIGDKLNQTYYEAGKAYLIDMEYDKAYEYFEKAAGYKDTDEILAKFLDVPVLLGSEGVEIRCYDSGAIYSVGNYTRAIYFDEDGTPTKFVYNGRNSGKGKFKKEGDKLILTMKYETGSSKKTWTYKDGEITKYKYHQPKSSEYPKIDFNGTITITRDAGHITSIKAPVAYYNGPKYGDCSIKYSRSYGVNNPEVLDDVLVILASF